MTVAEKIKDFNSIDSLLSEIDKDTISNDVLRNRYAVRFILLENFDLLKELIQKLSQKGVSSFDLETLTSDNDDWITKDELKKSIENLHGQIVVSPFSEIVRFYKDDNFKAFFHEISLLEKTITDRIYIPLIGLKLRFENFLSSFGRIEESAPVWSVYCSENQPVEIYLVPDEIATKSNLNCLKTVKDWLKFWKTYAPTEKILCSSDTINTFSKYSQPDNIFQFNKVDNAYQFITQLLELQINIEFIESEKAFWLKLLNNIKQKNLSDFSFKAFVNRYFNVHELSLKDILNKWTNENSTDFDRWLLKHYYLLLINNNEYLNNIILDCGDYSSLRLFKDIALSIFVNTTNVKKFIEERNNLLHLLDKQYHLPNSDLTEMEGYISDIVKSDTEKAISLCSGRFDFEKEMFIAWYKTNNISLSKLQEVYPDFVAYLKDSKIDSWVNSYIQSYKQAKIEDKYTDEIRNFIAEKNANENTFYEWYHDFELSKELLAKEKSDKVYWIDGLGIEYLSLIQEIISNSTFEIKILQIAKTGIPSSTEHNKFEGVVKFEDLDPSYIHNNLYQCPPRTICREIEIIKDIFSKILNQSSQTTITIVSDHGLTALSRLVDSKKYTAKASHEGRYIKLDSTDCLKDSDYIRCKNGDDNFKVALTHASLNCKPVREVHGGCTPEEILVPFIVISNKKADIETIQKHIHIVEQNISDKTEPKQTVGFEEENLF